MTLTVADMNRLEEAARVSMGGFQELEASAPPPPGLLRPSLRLVAFTLLAMVVVIIVMQLI
ncbi:hypothetical protein [Mesorhizobium sp. INR15]|uniref:hypothetical protein n=1 Tax=Mesorhizobium sp. INR15 TaxID=2654248 RepID=UPI0021563353|nr:hypothetical protein [Mesorhizobium sp. INR15]